MLDRIEALERRQQKLYALALVLAVGLAVQVAWRLMPGEDRMEATRYSLMGRDRIERGALEVGGENSAQLRLNDEAGRARAMIFVRPGGDVVMRLTDANGQHRSQVWLDSQGVPTLQMVDATGRSRQRIGLAPDGQPYVNFYDADHNVFKRLP